MNLRHLKRLLLPFVVLVQTGFFAMARQTNVTTETNGRSEAEMAMSNLVAQAGEMIQTNDLMATNDDTTTPGNDGKNSNPPMVRPQSDSRTQNAPRAQTDDRRSWRRNRDRSDSSYGSDRNASPSFDDNSSLTNSGPARMDFASFRMIADFNIFDPNRYPHSGPRQTVRRPSPVVDSFALVGVLSYENGTFAFFNGSSSEYQKALKIDDLIAGYKVAGIDANSVKLTAGTNQVELQVGMQLRREDQGEWAVSTQSDSYASPGTPPPVSSPSALSSTTPAAPAAQTETTSNGAESDVLKRLMQRREQE
jgi:hypothetical protein